MLGLNISSAFNSAVTIYILIPFLLIPQILLSGVIVKFEELNPKISSRSVVPFSGDVMASRWAFEALAVNQFVNNKYEKQIYNYEKEISNSNFKKVYWISKMEDLATESKNLTPALSKGEGVSSEKLEMLKHEVSEEMKAIPEIPFTSLDKISVGNFNENTFNELRDYLTNIKKHYAERYDNAIKNKDDWMGKFQETESGKTEYASLQNNYQNTKIEELVKNSNSDMAAVIEESDKLIATTDPIFRDGKDNHFIRSHFFAPTKNIFGKLYSTYWVNICVIWGMSLLLWFTLYFDVLRKILNWFTTLPNKIKFIQGN
jgi:hypothetical protein